MRWRATSRKTITADKHCKQCDYVDSSVIWALLICLIVTICNSLEHPPMIAWQSFKVLFHKVLSSILCRQAIIIMFLYVYRHANNKTYFVTEFKISIRGVLNASWATNSCVCLCSHPNCAISFRRIFIFSPHLPSPSLSGALFVTTSCSASALTLASSVSHFLYLVLTTLVRCCSSATLHTSSTPTHPHTHTHTSPIYSSALSSDRRAQWRKARLDFKRLLVYLSPPCLNCQEGTAPEINSFLPPLHF